MEDQMSMPKPGEYLSTMLDHFQRSAKGNFHEGDRKLLVNLLRHAARNSIKFLAELDQKPDKSLPMVRDDFRPPYPNTVVEGLLFGGHIGVIMLVQDMGTHAAVHLTHTEDQELARRLTPGWDGDYRWSVSGFVAEFPYGPEPVFDTSYKVIARPLMCGSLAAKGLLPFDPESDAVFDRTDKQVVALYSAFCQKLASHKTTTTDIEPDPTENRRRRIRGKAPLYTYKLLTIGERKETASSRGRGGTHASPRSHLRRGFYRTSKKGVRHWVSSAYVNGAPGFVHKDYEIK
jgi:hypothetical protein